MQKDLTIFDMTIQIANTDYYFVAFIDILGFSNMVKSDLEAPVGSEKYMDKLYSVHKKTKELVVEGIDLELIQFSDSVVISTKFNKDVFELFLEIICEYQYDLYCEGILTRGGVAYGKHFFQDGFLYSMGLIESYNIEAKMAKYPRIVVSNDLLDLLYSSTNDMSDLPLLKEVDGLTFIDYFRNRDNDSVRKQLDFILDNNNNASGSVLEKLLWLKEYYSTKFPNDCYEIKRYEEFVR